MTRPEGRAIGAKAILFSELLHKGCFEVPWHQRYYDWTEADVRALLLDIEEALRENRSCYFVGAVILVSKQNGNWEINDGQQRIVTVSLIFAALCHRFAYESHDSTREDLALRLLFDIHNSNVGTLDQAEHYRPRVNPPLNDRVHYRQLIRGNTLGTNGKLTSAWRVIDDFLGTKNEQSRWEKFFDYICKRLEVACLTVPRQIDPNAVFETINCRGKPLGQLDLIRNFLYSHFNDSQEIQRRETLHENLERIGQVFPSTKTAKRAEDYVRCRLQCRFGFLPRETFYRDVRRTIREHTATPKSKTKPRDLIFELAQEITRPEDLELYRRLIVPTASPEFLREFEAKSKTADSTRNLTVFLRELKRYSVTHTLIFALLSKYVHATGLRRQRRTARLVNNNLSRLASFVLRTAFVAPKFEPSHFERRFADFAAQLYSAQHVPDSEFADFLRECDRLEHNVLDDDKFENAMTTLEMRGNQKIKLLLLGLNPLDRPDTLPLSDAHASVEHILPTAKQYWASWTSFGQVNSADWVHRIGNLTLMARGDNKPGGKFNDNFARKTEVYKDSSVAITRELALLDNWSPSQIDRRQRRMATDAVRIWSFN